MSLVCLLGGVILVAMAALDALWTTLWVDGHAGPLTALHASWIRRAVWRLTPRGNHRVRSLTGPLVLVSSVLTWVLLLWAGWALLFSADPHSLLHSHRGTPAGLVDRVYFTGYTLFTMGNGDFSPRSGGWQLTAAATSLSGLFLLTLCVTYLLTVLQAVVQKRSFAGQVWALGRTPEEFVVHAWSGGGFPAVELQIVSLTQQLNKVGDQHGTYPLLHYFHAAHERQSLPLAVAVFEGALALLQHGVREEHRPAPAAVLCAVGSVRLLMDTLGTISLEPSGEPPPLPDLKRLRDAGIPTVSDGALAASLEGRRKHRRLLRAFVDGEDREWPGPRG